MTIRAAERRDIPLLTHIMVKSFRSAFRGFVSAETMDRCTNETNCRAMLEQIYQDNTMHFLIGETQGMLVWQDHGSCAEITAVHSLPESWGSGLGHAMLEKALNQIGPRPMYLWAFRENTRARLFYEKHGFRWDGTERISEFDGAAEVRYIR